jgi:hypothetical protein
MWVISSSFFSLALGSRNGLLPLLFGEDFPICKLAEVLSDEGELRVGGAPYELAGLFDDTLVILADDLRRVRMAKRIGYVMVVRRDEQGARLNGQ